MDYLFLPLLFIEDIIQGWAADIYDAAIGLDALKPILETVSFTKGGVDYSIYWGVINNAIAVIKPFGYALVTTFFLMNLLDNAAKDNITMDSIIKVLMQLVLTIAVIGNLDLIINAFLSIGESIINLIRIKVTANSTTTAVDGATIVEHSLENEQGYIAILLEGFLIWIVHYVAVIGCVFACLSRALDVGWRIILAPIGVSNCFEGGISSSGIKYLKSLFASILSSGAIYIIVIVGFGLAGSLLGDGTDSKTLVSCGALLATAGAAIGANSKAKEVIS